jgi:hypothetical protein
MDGWTCASTVSEAILPRLSQLVSGHVAHSIRITLEVASGSHIVRLVAPCKARWVVTFNVGIQSLVHTSGVDYLQWRATKVCGWGGIESPSTLYPNTSVCVYDARDDARDNARDVDRHLVVGDRYCAWHASNFRHMPVTLTRFAALQDGAFRQIRE